jgi:hypothetical protein
LYFQKIRQRKEKKPNFLNIFPPANYRTGREAQATNFDSHEKNSNAVWIKILDK